MILSFEYTTAPTPLISHLHPPPPHPILCSSRALRPQNLSPIIPPHHPQLILLIPLHKNLRLIIPRDLIYHLEKLQHALIRAWHDVFRKDGFARREAIAVDVLAAVEGGVERIWVDEVGAGALGKTRLC